MVLQPQYELYIQGTEALLVKRFFEYLPVTKDAETTSESTNIWTKLHVCRILYGDIHSIYSYWKIYTHSI